MQSDRQARRSVRLAWSSEGLGRAEEPEARPAPRKERARPERDESLISRPHAQLLEWFFTEGRSTFGRSTCGAIIDRLRMFAFGSKECKACRGTGFRGGWSYGDPPKGKRARADELAALLGVSDAPGNDADERDARCDLCRGSGVIARSSKTRASGPITARPKPAPRAGGGYTPTDYALQHYAIACRRLDQVHRASGRAGVTLEAFYGDWGARWADTKQGRLFAVYVLTPAGHKLLRMSRDKARLEDAELRPDEVLGVEFELQRAQPLRQRGDLFTSAREQAKRMLDQAHREWNRSEGPPPPRPVAPAFSMVLRSDAEVDAGIALSRRAREQLAQFWATNDACAAARAVQKGCRALRPRRKKKVTPQPEVSG